MTAAAAQVLAFRYARSGLARRAGDLAAAAAVPASDFARDAALAALAARAEPIDRERYDAAVDRGEIVVAYALRGAIHALAPADHMTFGAALVGADDRELAAQLGRGTGRAELETVTAAVGDALAAGPLARDELHAALRQRLPPALLPWCERCRSHHVAPRLWRYATILSGVRIDARRRHVAVPLPPAGDPVERFLRAYGPATPEEFGAWAGVTPRHARRLWPEGIDRLLPQDAAALDSPPEPRGLRLLPPGDPFLQAPNRPLLAPDPELRRRLFRPVASPGVVLLDGRVAGTWTVNRGAIAAEPLGPRLPADALAAEAERLARVLARP